MSSILDNLNKLIDEHKKSRLSSRLIERMTSLKESEPEVLKYIEEKIQNIQIKIGGDKKEKAFHLIASNKLMGWCWQSSETLSLMFNDSDYVERGDLFLPEENNRQYFHSWLNFEFKDKEYVLDPALNILCLREKYFEHYNVQLKAIVPAKEVKERFVQELKHNKQKNPSWMDEYLTESSKENLNKETLIKGTNGAFDPFFISDIGYVAKLDKCDNIEELSAHYYYKG